MKKIILVLLIAMTALATQAQKITKYKGWADETKCEITYTTKVKKGTNGMEDAISYAGTLSIGTKKTPIRGYFEGNTIVWEEKIGGKWTETMEFDLSGGDENYNIICKRTIGEFASIIKLNEVKNKK
jgi:hypothetical protein